MTYEEALAIAQANNASDNQDFVIDKMLRTIAVPDGFIAASAGEESVQAIPFVMPRYYNGIDLSELKIGIQSFGSVVDWSSYEMIPPEEIEVGEDTLRWTWWPSFNTFSNLETVYFGVIVESFPDQVDPFRRFMTRPAELHVVDSIDNFFQHYRWDEPSED